MNAVTVTGHMSAYQLRKAARKAAAEKLTPEEMQKQVNHCEKRLKERSLSPDLKRSLTERMENLKAKLSATTTSGLEQTPNAG
jgi:hypothetical protein